jgi:hypothetical protein
MSSRSKSMSLRLLATKRVTVAKRADGPFS